MIPSLCLLLLAAAICAAAAGTPASALPPRAPQATHLNPAVRSWVGGGPCKRGDYRCMNAEALKVVNMNRRKEGERPYEMGTKAMLAKAMTHSFLMQQDNAVFNQNLSNVDLGCGSYIAAENVASIEGFGPGASDPARDCVMQLKTSKAYRDNIMSPLFRQTVLAVYVDSADTIWCTQFFVVNTRFQKRGECSQADTQVRRQRRPKKPTPSPRRRPKTTRKGAKPPPKKPQGLDAHALIGPMQAKNGHVFSNKKFIGRFRNGRTAQFELRRNKRMECVFCTVEAGYCTPGDWNPRSGYYCTQKAEFCLFENASVAMDKRIVSRQT